VSKKVRVQCKGHDGYFYAEPGKEWMFLCKKCYKKYYVEMRKKYSAQELRDNWDELFAKFKADKEESLARAREVVAQILEDSRGDCINPY